MVEIMIALVILAVIMYLFAQTFIEAATVGKTVTTDAELRAKAQDALTQIANDMRSTLLQSGNVTVTTGSALNAVSFYREIPAPGPWPQFTSPYFTTAANPTIYWWVPTDTAIRLSPYDQTPPGTLGTSQGVSFCGASTSNPNVKAQLQVTNFYVTTGTVSATPPTGGTVTSTYPSATFSTPVTFTIVLQLTRTQQSVQVWDQVQQKYVALPQTVTLTTAVTVPPG